VNIIRRALFPCVSVERSRARNNKHRSSYPLTLSQHKTGLFRDLLLSFNEIELIAFHLTVIPPYSFLH
jgi:hypothetical protein